MVQWLRCHALRAGGLGLIPGQGTRSHRQQLKSSHATTKDPACCKEDLAQPNKNYVFFKNCTKKMRIECLHICSILNWPTFGYLKI